MATIQCPRCQSEAYYSYGHLRNGRQRYICLVCNRQFTNAESPRDVLQRPECPLCGKKMHVYMRNGRRIRFRCSDYPQCRGYSKALLQEV